MKPPESVEWEGKAQEALPPSREQRMAVERDRDPASCVRGIRPFEVDRVA